MIKGKKADATEIFLVLFMLVFLAISFLVVAFAMSKFKEVIESNAELNSTSPAPSIINSLDRISITTIPNAFMFITAFFIIGMLASAFLIRIHPIFLFIYIIFTAVAIFTSVFLGNVYQDLTEVDALSEIAAEQEQTNWIMEHIVLITLAMGGLSMIVTFSKLLTPTTFGGGERL